MPYSRYHLLIANYDKFNFKQFEQEKNSKEYTGLGWVNATRQHYEKGDVVYIYYCNLPDGTAKILFSGEIKNNNIGQDENGYNIFTIANIKALNPKDHNKFSTKSLKEKYGIKTFRDSSYLYEKEYSKLISDISTTINNNEIVSFKDMVDQYFKFKCEFEDYEFNNNGKSKKIKHQTFKRVSNVDYFEMHHFIPQNAKKDNKIKNEFIDSPLNLLKLCPLCHKMIHQADIKTRKEMIDYLYDKKKEVLTQTGVIEELLKSIKLDTQEKYNIDEIIKNWLYSKYITKEISNYDIDETEKNLYKVFYK